MKTMTNIIAWVLFGTVLVVLLLAGLLTRLVCKVFNSITWRGAKS